MLVKSLLNENGMLAALAPAVHARLTPHLKRVRLEAGSVLFDIGSTSDHAWFITEGIASLFTTTKAGDIIEAASVGQEGVVGLSGIAKRNGMALWAQMQISDEAFQVGLKILQGMLRQEIALYDLLFEYSNTLSEQIALTVGCNQFHNTEQRLARWLLMARDRISSDSMALTHDIMGQMLGVSRSGVSLAVGALQMKGLTRHARGRITLLNSEGLEVPSCECYRILSRTINPSLSPEARLAPD
jgi:CRP-like cAMP-binding protein